MSSDNAIRVAQVLGKMHGGGVEAVVMNYYRHIDRDKVQFDFIVDSDSTYIPREEIESLGGRIFKVPPYQNLPKYRKELRGVFQAGGYEIVHSHINTLSVFPLQVAKSAGVKVRISHSHSTMGKGEFLKNALKLALRPFAKVYPTELFACGRYAGDWLYGANADFTVINNAIDLDKFTFDAGVRANIREKLGLGEGEFVVGHVGRFATQKNHAFLINAFAGLLNSIDDAKLLLVGMGELEEEMRMQISQIGIEDNVIFAGQVDNPNDYYMAFDLFALPSLYEGLCVVGVEAQASGLPSLFSNCITDEIGLTDLAQFLPIEDPAVWANAFKEQYKIREKTRTDRSNVDKGALAPFDITKEAEKLCDMYVELAKRASV